MIRADNYDMLRSMAGRKNYISANADLDLPEIEVASLRVFTNDGEIVGKPLLESGIRQRFSVTVVAIRRGSETLLNISPSTYIKQGDIIYVVGKPSEVLRFNNYLKAD